MKKQSVIVIGAAALVGVIVLINVLFNARLRLKWPLWVPLLPWFNISISYPVFCTLLLLGIVVIILLIRAGYNAQWTKKRDLLDWLNVLGVLAIPVIVAAGTLYFTQQITQQQEHLADVQHQADLQNSVDQQRTTILQTYFTNLQDLLLNHNLLNPQQNSDVREIARAQTLTALDRLGSDTGSKKSLLLFLYEAGLINASDGKGNKLGAVIDLHFDLTVDHPWNAPLFVNLEGVSFYKNYLAGIDLSGVDLNDANFEFADLSYANLSQAPLEGVDLDTATLSYADLSYADFAVADLSSANLSYANLSYANLGYVNLSHANLSHANLSITNLTQQELDQVYTCFGATLPQGLTCHHNQPPT